ncbi:EAL domain-containing protein [Roseateles violae]|uniref:EAL domain-containing protein n=1 Tax=Roseateles violae TaxID=3058042 RepID=A0ABT8DP31_9BURK|nr:EAL domain-containing protein [Pelomonas sp. PFR6]MDN3918694.1 EAL domain-containing protein [Pelomonas sp. PFR6]
MLTRRLPMLRGLVAAVWPWLCIIVALVALAGFSVDTLSAARAFVGGESLWSKAQKQALSHLERYARSGRPAEYAGFERAIALPLGDRRARLAMEAQPVDRDEVMQGFLLGGNHADDVPGMARLFLRFNNFGPVAEAVDAWRAADAGLLALMRIGRQMREAHRSGAGSERLPALLDEAIAVDAQLTLQEQRFSAALGEASRQVQTVLLATTLVLALLLTGLGLWLTGRLVRREQGAAAQLSHQASHDALTGLMNRREFERRAALVIRDARAGVPAHALLYLDLDQFKTVNDSCGHAAGDELLCQVAQLLKARLRAGDALARLGGDEFGILLDRCGPDNALRIAEQLRASIVDFRFIYAGRVFAIGVSVGLVQLDTGMQRLSDAMDAVDAACYQAKAQGRNRVQVHRAGDEHAGAPPTPWARRIETALEQGRLCLHAQAIEPADPTLADRGAQLELLLRMQDVDGRLLPPMAFLPAAERHQLMPAIDRWVVASAFEAIAARGAQAPQRCAINLSAASLADEQFADFVREQRRRSGIAAERICFEIDEAALMATLHAEGFRFGLDNFGSGMAAFAPLRSLPLDYLKIDGGLVKDLLVDPLAEATVRAIQQIAATLGLRTIAAFVDGEAMRRRLHELGIDQVQGFGIARPAPFVAAAADEEARARV